jgi:hypothetical protein
VGKFITETRSLQRSEYFLTKNSLLCALGTAAVRSLLSSHPPRILLNSKFLLATDGRYGQSAFTA